MLPTSVIALFCQDIREEKSDTVTVVGILPDNAKIPPLPDGAPPGATGIMPKLCVYIRVHFDPHNKLGRITGRFVFPDNADREFEAASEEIVEKARVESLERGHPVAAFFTRLEMVPFPVTAGRAQVEITIGSETYICGALNFQPETN